MSGRDANQLAADVRDALDFSKGVTGKEQREAAVAALDDLVGLVGTLQQERDDQLKITQNVYGLLVEAKRERNAAEAALAETRQALTEIGNANVFHAKALARRALTDTGVDTA